MRNDMLEVYRLQNQLVTSFTLPPPAPILQMGLPNPNYSWDGGGKRGR